MFNSYVSLLEGNHVKIHYPEATKITRADHQTNVWTMHRGYPQQMVKQKRPIPVKISKWLLSTSNFGI